MDKIRKPELGRPTDSRLTAEVIASNPRLYGLKPFDPEYDVDIVDEVNKRLGQLHALVAYADPEMAAEMESVIQRAADVTLAANTAIDDARTAVAQAEQASATALLTGGHIQYVVDNKTILTATPAAVGELGLTLDTMTLYRLVDGQGWIRVSGTGGGTGGAGLVSINHDVTLTGEGTSENPLGVAGIGQPKGIAPLGEDGKVPAAMLPDLTSSSSGYRLVRTVAGATYNLALTSNPITDGRVAEIVSTTGFDADTLYYDAAAQVLRHGPLSDGAIWVLGQPPRSAFTFGAFTNITQDFYGNRHIGLWLQTAEGTAATGYRLANLGNGWSVQWYSEGNALGAVGNSISGPTINLNQTYHLSISVDETGLLRLWVNDSAVGSWALPEWTGGRPGIFAYRVTAEYRQIAFGENAPATINALPAGALARLPDGSAPGSVLALHKLTRIDACDVDGSVLASAWVNPGDTWELRG